MDTYKNAALPVEQRIDDLLKRMTLREKIGQLNQRMLGWNAYEQHPDGEGFELTPAFREEVAFGDGLGALYGLFRADPWSKVTFGNGIPAVDSAKMANEIQRHVIENTRLGIPVLLSEECPHGHQALDGTMFPTNLAVGSTWNPALYEQAYAKVAAELRARGAHVGLVSTLDLLRDPRWGRSEECFGEDPYLSAAMTAAAVRGLQGESREQLSAPDKVVACLKHLAAQGACFGGHNAAAATIGERELREIHLTGIRAGVEAGALACMAAYNEIDGIACHANETLLTDILRDELAFEGIVMSDGCAVDGLVPQAGSAEAAVAMAIQAGVDLNLWNDAFLTIEQAVQSGMLTEELVDRAVERVLRLKFELGLFENPYTDEKLAAEVLDADPTRALNREVARQSVVLLKNEDGRLPLKPSTGTIAVIGPNADNLYNQLGDYTPTQREGRGATVLQGIRQALQGASGDAEVVYARGCGIRDTSTDGFQEAVEAAKRADIAVMVMGGSSARDFSFRFADNGAAIADDGAPKEMDCGEGLDVANLELGGVQIELMKAIHATGTPIVAVLIQGRPHAIPWIKAHCQAVLTAWYPGEEGGHAIADVLFGSVNPSGKLPVSIPNSSAQLPVAYNLKASLHAAAYVDETHEPLYPFGYGLSYTSFEYGGLRISSERIAQEALYANESVTLSVDVRNTGSRRGQEVVQLYLFDRVSSIRPRRSELKAFRKIELDPGETATVAFQVGIEALSQWDKRMKYVPEAGRLRLGIGIDRSRKDLQALLHIDA